MIVVLVLLAIIGYGAYRLVSSHGAKPGHPAAAATVSTRPSVRPTPTPTTKASPTPTPAPPQLVIKVTATEDCWISLTKQSDGSQLYIGVVSAGNSMTWTEQSAVQMVLGNPGGVVLTVNGQEEHPNPNTVAHLNFSLPSGSQSG
jgi:hypothetical protein